MNKEEIIVELEASKQTENKLEIRKIWSPNQFEVFLENKKSKDCRKSVFEIWLKPSKVQIIFSIRYFIY